MKTSRVQHLVVRPSANRGLLDPPTGASQVPAAAPRRGLDVLCPTAWSLGAPVSEEALLEQVQQCCVAEGRRHFRQVELRSCQEVAPEAVSQTQPPQRCWLVRLAVSQQTDTWTGDEVQGIVYLAAGALHLVCH